MTQRAIPAVIMRGGTSKAIMFHARVLPPDRDAWSKVFTAAMGSPDPNGRQLDGMGGGVSSLSKVCVLAPSERDDADIDYTFAQILIKEDRANYSGNCGYMSSPVGPFAVDEGLVSGTGETATVRVYNTNTKKFIHATFPHRRVGIGMMPLRVSTIEVLLRGRLLLTACLSALRRIGAQ